MKKWIKIAVLSVLTVAGTATAEAQSPYKMSIGGIVGSMEGASFKMFLADKIALQADFGIKFVATSTSQRDPYLGRYRYVYSYGSLEVNPNVVFQNAINTWNAGGLYWFAGGGLSIGYAFGLGYRYGYGLGSNGKFGVNATGGTEFAFTKIPLTVQFDFRPGYGLLFRKGGHASHFDWTLGLSARYIIGR